MTLKPLIAHQLVDKTFNPGQGSECRSKGGAQYNTSGPPPYSFQLFVYKMGKYLPRIANGPIAVFVWLVHGHNQPLRRTD